jgi:DNA recombination protein RmuC
MEIIASVVSLLIGLLVGWLWRNQGAKTAEREHGAQQARLEARDARLSELESEVEERRDAERDVSHEAVRLRTQLESANKRLEEREADQTLMVAQFKESAGEIMEDRSKAFQERSQKSITELVKPLKDQLEGFRKELTEKGQEANQERISLQEQVKLLRQENAHIGEEARNLTRVLKGDSKARGNWGELALSRILESSGLEEGRDFVREKSETVEDNKRLRPDVIINLPDARHIVIDAKVTLTAYDAYCHAESDQDRAVAMKAHIAAIRTHVKGLGDKSYEHLGSLNTVDFVLMFMPVEPAFTEAMREDRAFFEEAISQRVLIVTPSNLIAILRTVESIWRRERQTKNVLEIARQAGGLYDKFVGFAGVLEKLGKQLDAARTQYDMAMSQLSTGKDNLVRKVQRLDELGAKTKKQLPEHLIEASVQGVEALPATAPVLKAVNAEDEDSLD